MTWVQSDECAALFPELPNNATKLWQATVESFSWSRPDVKMSREELDLGGSFWFTSARCSVTPGGWLLLELTVITMSFAPHWSNPLWELMEFDMDAEFDQV